MTVSDSHTQSAEARLAKAGLEKRLLPKHVAIIMDGNGRWAMNQGKERIMGHARGAQMVDPLITEAAALGMEQMTLYSFSAENWKRPETEISFLMELCKDYLQTNREKMLENNIRFQQLGRRAGLPESVLEEIDKTIEITKNNTGTVLALALNYGSRTEITDAVREIAEAVRDGQMLPEQITEKTVSEHLYTRDMPDPDLMIRTAGEMRISNYLLWQISYAELYITDVLWPEFSLDEFYKALAEFARRQRRFGGVKSVTGSVDQDLI